MIVSISITSEEFKLAFIEAAQDGDVERISDTLNLKNAKEAKERCEFAIAHYTERREDCLAKFNRLHRCLAIVLDRELVNFALVGDSFVRKVTNYHVHRKMADEQILTDAMGRFDDLLKDYPHEKSEEWTSAEVESQSHRLKSLLSIGKDFFAKNDMEVDEAVDVLMGSEFDGTAPDLGYLLGWFNAIFPVGGRSK